MEFSVGEDALSCSPALMTVEGVEGVECVEGAEEVSGCCWSRKSHDKLTSIEELANNEQDALEHELQALHGEEKDAPRLYLQVKTQESTSEAGEYRVFHQIAVVGDERGEVAADCVSQVTYSMPGQGFREDSRRKLQPPFAMRFGPCWGRPHVTVDVELRSGKVLSGAFEGNLPQTDATIPLRAVALTA